MSSIGPELPPHLKKSNESDKSYDEEIGVALPPHLVCQEQKTSIGPHFLPEAQPSSDNTTEIQPEDKDSGYGPALPPGFSKELTTRRIVGPTMRPQKPSSSENDIDDNSDDDDDIVGPCLPQPSEYGRVKTVEEEYEERSRAMKDKLTGKQEDGALKREDWMLELPPGFSKNFGLGPRTFRSKAVDLGDRSVWTDTPADVERKSKERRDAAMKAAGEKRKSNDSQNIKTPTKEEMKIKACVDEYNQATRPKSLLEIHQDKRKKTEPDASSARRPFDRERDLSLKQRDPKATAKFIHDAKGLNSKFSKGSYEK